MLGTWNLFGFGCLPHLNYVRRHEITSRGMVPARNRCMAHSPYRVVYEVEPQILERTICSFGLGRTARTALRASRSRARGACGAVPLLCNSLYWYVSVNISVLSLSLSLSLYIYVCVYTHILMQTRQGSCGLQRQEGPAPKP